MKPTVSVFHFHSLSSSLFRNKISLFPISQNTSSASTTRLTKRIQKPLNWISKIWIVVWNLYSISLNSHNLDDSGREPALTRRRCIFHPPKSILNRWRAFLMDCLKSWRLVKIWRVVKPLSRSKRQNEEKVCPFLVVRLRIRTFFCPFQCDQYFYCWNCDLYCFLCYWSISHIFPSYSSRSMLSRAGLIVKC